MSKEQIKFSPLGALPHGWSVKPLKSLCTKIGSGATPRGGKEVYLDERESHALIRSQNVFDHYFDETGLVYISEEHVQELRSVEVQSQDLLLNITGDGITFARACIVPDQVLPACVNQHVSIIRTDQNTCIPGYLLGYLTLPSIKTYIEFFNSGGSRRAITKGNIETFEIPLPPLNVQKEIAKTIQNLNGKVENLRKQNEILEAIAQTLFNHWFVDFEFPNADGKPYKSSGGTMEPSELGDIPSGWRVGNLGDEVETLGGGTPSTKEPDYWVDGDILWYSPTDLTKSNTLFSLGSDKHITKLGLEKSSARLFPAYSILLTSRATIGEITINTKPACTNQGFITILPNEKFSVYFLHGWLLTQINLIKQLASGSTFPELSKSTFRKFLFLIPAPRQLENYDQAINPLFQKTENNTRQIQILTQTRDVLLPKLMSGKLRITS
jgi:type I restriction enzyme S subunit